MNCFGGVWVRMLEWCHLLAAIADTSRTVLMMSFHKSKAHSIKLRQSALMSVNNAKGIHRKSGPGLQGTGKHWQTT